MTDDDLDALRRGVELRDGLTRPAIVHRLTANKFEITITEGRNRQVRRMIEHLEAKVLKLVRVAIGPIRIGDLKIGEARELTKLEIKNFEFRMKN
jgi:pseudouridine synthase